MREKLTKKDTGFAQVKNEVLADKKLSWKAKGLFAYLYSKPDDWDFSMWRIKEDSKDGKESTRIGLKELEAAGYLMRTRQTDGRMHYHITYKPCSEKQNKEEKPCSENRNVRKSERGKIGTVSNKDLNTNKDIVSNKDITIDQNSPIEKQIGEIIYLFRNLNPVYRGWFQRPPVRNKCRELLETFGFQKVKNAILYAERTISDRYAPTITSPAQLENKWGALQAHYAKNTNKKPKVAIIPNE